MGDAPHEGIKAHVERSGRAAAIVNIIGAEANDGTESLLPRKTRQSERNFGIGSKLSASRAGCCLVLVDKQGTDEAYRIVAQVPTRGVTISGPGEGPSSKNEKVSAAVKAVENGGPGRFRNNGALRKNEKAGLRVVELRNKLIGRDEARFRKNLRELRGSGCRGIRRGQARLGPDNHGRKFLGEQGDRGHEAGEETEGIE